MRRTTIIYLLLFLGIVGIYYILNNREKPADIVVTPGVETPTAYLFSASDGVATYFLIESRNGEKVEITRGADNTWALKFPQEAKADPAALDAVTAQVTNMRVLDTIPSIDPDVVGLKTPEYTINIKFSSGVERKAEVGVITPTEDGYYVRYQDKIIIVGKDSVDALLNLLTKPPYLETPTASPTPNPVTETSIPATSTAGLPLTETATPKP